MHTFEVHPVNTSDPTETYRIVPSSVTFFRPQWEALAWHEEMCDGGERCPFEFNKAGSHEVPDEGLYKCDYRRGKQFTEICFVNTIGPQSSVVVTESVTKVREQIDGALRNV